MEIKITNQIKIKSIKITISIRIQSNQIKKQSQSVFNPKASLGPMQYFKYPATLRREEAAAAVPVTVSRLSLSHLLSGRGAVITHSGLAEGSRHILEG